MAQTTWATVEEVADITGVQPDANILQLANFIVEVHAKRMYETDVAFVQPRDAAWLKRAVAFQAAWLPGQDDLLERMNIRVITEAGRATELEETALELAPMAKRTLDNCSWRRSRSTRVQAPFADGGGPSADPTAEANDAYEQWRPM